jgi:eukaryotic translation initiation factor 2C
MAMDLLQQYKTATKMIPQRIIYIRDGVSEGQYAEILNVELAAIREAAKAITGPIKLAKITVIIAKKRHHTRFFPVSDANIDQNGNVSPGTVVDTGITHPVEFDFCNFRVVSTDHSHRPAQSFPRDGPSGSLSYLVYLLH